MTRANAASRIRSWTSAAGRPGRRSRASDITSLLPSFPAWRSLRTTRELRDVTGERLSADLERLAHGRIDVDEIDEVGQRGPELHRHRRFVDDLARALADDVDAKHALVDRRGDHLHQPGGAMDRPRAGHVLHRR